MSVSSLIHACVALDDPTAGAPAEAASGDVSDAAPPAWGPTVDRAGLSWAALGPRQRAVAEGVLAGETNAQIAARLDMSVHTVREHLKRMAGRLGARGRAGLIAGLVGLLGALRRRPRA